MNLQLLTIKETLLRLKPELKERFYVSAIGVFGSVARGDQTASSDIDIIVDFSRPVGIEFIDLADFLERKLRKQVDLVSRNGVKQQYLKLIEPEIVYV